MSPAASSTTSPGTSRSIGSSRCLGASALSCRLRSTARAALMSWRPSRRFTVAVVCTSWRRDWAARSERYSCEKRNKTLNIIIVLMINAAF